MKPIYLYVTPFFPSPNNWRGAYCYDFVRALMKTGVYEVRVFKPGNGMSYEYQGVVVHTFKVWKLPSNVFPFLFAERNARNFVAAVEKVADCEGWTWSDVAICHGNTATFSPYSVEAKNMSQKCLTLLHHHDLGSFGLQSGVLRHCWLYNLIQFPILRKWHERIDRHIFISELVKRNFLSAPRTDPWMCASYKKQMFGLPWRSVQIKDSCILYNGVDTTVFTQEGKRQGGQRIFTVGCVGNFSREKGQLTLLKAVNLLGQRGIEIQVQFIGSGGNIETCRRFASVNKLNVRFLSEVHHSDLPDFYRGIDLFVLPSVWDGFGCVYTEAWACGVPFITTDGAGAKELVAEPEKWVARIDDVNDLADKIAGYHAYHWAQRLIGAVDIDTLTLNFVRGLAER